MVNKIVLADKLEKIIKNLKSKGKKVILCHGVFDLLHIGHIRHFQEAKSLGDILVVSITESKFVNKGPSRPAFNDRLRLEALSALNVVDYVTINSTPTATQIIKNKTEYLL